MKTPFAVIILLLCSSMMFGQSFSVGANLGLNYDMSNSGVEGAETWSGLGYGGGLVLDLGILPMLGVEIDVQYAQYKYSATINDTNYTGIHNNLVIPILLKYKMTMPVVSPNFILGPSIIKELSEVSKKDEKSFDVADSLLETDVGIQVGASADLGMVPIIGISPYFRFQYNLTANDPDTDNAEKMYDFLFGVNFTYKIK